MTTDEQPDDRSQPWTLSQGLSVTLVVVGPTFLFSELWRGRPIIDQSGDIWLIPAAIMAIGFFVGGMFAGSRRRTPDQALMQGVVLGSLVITLLFIVDVIRRMTRDQGIPPGVLGLWVAAAVAALLVSSAGGLYGRRRARRRVSPSG